MQISQKHGTKLCHWPICIFFTARPAHMADNMQQNSIKISTLPQLGLTTIGRIRLAATVVKESS